MKSKQKPLTVAEFFKQFPDDESCLTHLFEVRFGQDYTCPKCNREDGKWYRIKAERAYSCQFCGHHLHPTVGTLFEKSRTPLQLWFYAIYLFTTTRHGVSAKELERQLGVTYKTAWRMGHEIRKHMAEVDGEDPLEGEVEVDESWIGGKQKGKANKNKNKTVLFGMIQREGKVMTKVVADVKRNTLQPHIQANVKAGSTIHSDELKSYVTIRDKGYKHQTVRHGMGQYVKGNCHTNSIEGFWSLLKNGIISTHKAVSAKHLEKYAKEFEYRYNSRDNSAGMFPELITDFKKG